MTLEEALKRIEELETRIKALEQRPVYYPAPYPVPFQQPYYVPPVLPHFPQPWQPPYIITC